MQAKTSRTTCDDSYFAFKGIDILEVLELDLGFCFTHLYVD